MRSRIAFTLSSPILDISIMSRLFLKECHLLMVFFPLIHARNSPLFIPSLKPLSSITDMKFIYTWDILSLSASTVNGVPVEPLVESFVSLSRSSLNLSLRIPS